MEMQSILRDCKVVRCLNAVAAGTTTEAGTAVDTRGYDGVVFVAALGALTATQVTSLKAQQGAQANGSDAVDIPGAATTAMADGDSNRLAVVDVRRPTSRYVRPVVVRGTAMAVIDGVIAILYRGVTLPVVQDPTQVAVSALATG